ncbi:MAG: hypothetical protein NDJ94_04795 [Vicinamibacteria bacterium]|nr:hypothetical protein [Vicinamibacteria bacterium]
MFLAEAAQALLRFLRDRSGPLQAEPRIVLRGFDRPQRVLAEGPDSGRRIFFGGAVDPAPELAELGDFTGQIGRDVLADLLDDLLLGSVERRGVGGRQLAAPRFAALLAKPQARCRGLDVERPEPSRDDPGRGR